MAYHYATSENNRVSNTKPNARRAQAEPPGARYISSGNATMQKNSGIYSSGHGALKTIW